MCPKNFSAVDGGLSRGSSMCRPSKSAKSPPVKKYLTVEIAKLETGSFWFDQSEWTKEVIEKEKIKPLIIASMLTQLQSSACTPLRPKLWFTNTVEHSPQKSPFALSNLPLRMNG
jgi:hypothetical protein